MRIFIVLFGCLLALGCASPSQPPKPSPYLYGALPDMSSSAAYPCRLRAKSHRVTPKVQPHQR